MKTATFLRIAALILVFSVILPFAMSACGGKTTASGESDTDTDTDTDDDEGDDELTPVSFETIDNHKTEKVAGGYEIDMGDIVQLYFENHPEWVELYNKSWQLHKSHIQKIPAATNPESPYYVDEAFSGDIFLWDTVFMMLYDRYGMNQFPNLASMDNFYYRQTDSTNSGNGYIPREINEQTGKDYNSGYRDQNATNPPLLSWAEWECYQIHGDVSRFSKEINGKTIYQRLCEHYKFIEKNKKMKDKLYGKTSGLGTGLDDSPNQGSGQTYNSLSIQQAQNAYYIAKIAEAMGNKKDAEYYYSEHKRISKLINDLMWDENESMYSNLTTKGEHTNISTPTSLWALVGLVATEKTAKAMVENQALNSNNLFRPNGLATLSYGHEEFKSYGGYWKGSIWAPTSYQYIKGLCAYGYDTVAFEESLRLVNTLSAVYEAGKKGGYVPKATLFENYSTEYLRPGWWHDDCQLTREDFAGWTPCMSIGLLIENVAGVTINAPENKVYWNVKLSEHHSISNLYFCHGGEANRVSLAAGERSNADEDLIFSVKADKPFTLVVTASGETKEYEIAAGETTIRHTKNKAAATVSAIELYAVGFNNEEDKAAITKEKADAALDYVCFTSKENDAIKDGVAYQSGKLRGLIYNVNTVGKSPLIEPKSLLNEANSDVAALGYTGATELSRYYYKMGNEGFMLCAEATKQTRTLKLVVSVAEGTKATITASVSDASAKSQSLTLEGGKYIVTIPYSAASDGRYLFVKWTIDNAATKGVGSAAENKAVNVGLSLAVLFDGKVA